VLSRGLSDEILNKSIRELYHKRLSSIGVFLLWKTECLRSLGMITSLLQEHVVGSMAVMKYRLLPELKKTLPLW